MVGHGQVGHHSRGGRIMNNTIGNHDLITAENIMGYLQARCAELKADDAASGSNSNRIAARLAEVEEMLVHVEGDLDSLIHDRFAQSDRG